MNWRELLATLDRDGTPHALVTVVEALGSTPREAGAKMVVTEGEFWGSIGGGNLEHEAIKRARALIRQGVRIPSLEKNALGPDLGQCCGGLTTLLFEPFAEPRSHLALFGAGHVGRALVRVLDGTRWRVLWVDERAEAFPAPAPDFVRVQITDEPTDLVPSLPAGCHCLVMTHSHETDFELIKALLARGDLGSVGLIGSKTKWARFRKRLVEVGIPEAAIARVECPIGLPGLAGKRPAEIAISVAAQLLQRQEPA